MKGDGTSILYSDSLCLNDCSQWLFENFLPIFRGFQLKVLLIQVLPTNSLNLLSMKWIKYYPYVAKHCMSACDFICSILTVQLQHRFSHCKERVINLRSLSTHLYMFRLSLWSW